MASAADGLAAWNGTCDAVRVLIRAGAAVDAVDDLDSFDFIRTIAVARILMPASHVRLSAGRESMADPMQALAFLAGANSIFYGEKLLTTANPATNKDRALFVKLGIQALSFESGHNPADENAMSASKNQQPKHDARFYNAVS